MCYRGYLCNVTARETQQPARGLRTTMTITFTSLIFIWLLPLTASSEVTSSPTSHFTDVMTSGVTQNNFAQGHLTAQEESILNALSEVTGHYITPSATADGKPIQEKNTTASTPSLQTTQTPSNTFLPVNPKPATPDNIIMSQSVGGVESTTHLQSEVTSAAATVVTSEASDANTTTRILPVLSSSTQSQDTGETSTFRLTSDKMTHPSTHPQSTQLISTATTSTKPADESASTVQVTALYKTPQATTKTRFTVSSTATKRPAPPGKNPQSNNETKPGKAVAGIIGGALVLMMVGFLVIFIKKRKLKKQQISTTDWAGPSPFLEDGARNGHVTLRSSNRISLSSFLPQRLSKRLSLLPETDEELEDMTPGTTFGGKRQGNTFGQQVDGNDVQESNGTAAVVPEMKSTRDVSETVETSVTSAQTNDLLSSNNNSEAANLSQESASPPTPSAAVENAPAQLKDDEGQA